MGPVIDSGRQQTKEKNYQRPRSDLLINGLAIDSPSAFSVVKDRAHQTTYRGRGTDGKPHPQQIRNPETDGTADYIDGKHAVITVFSDRKRG